ncbi:MAG: single-stranded-DNA-specific exonuclease RecJ [Selenomonadaceae bacterium]|nr:single-stranded-DNA-specific exonuclease RecJ [Selenomonadaceae bacterium]
MKTWQVYKGDDEKAAKLSEELTVSKAFASILLERGVTSKEAAEVFLFPEENQPFHDPLLMQDMGKGTVRILQALAKKEKITVYGDYDVDGITATALLTKTLKALGASVDFYIPDRQKEGYGLNVEALKKLHENGTKLVVTVDCGIAGIDEVAAFNGIMDIIITDHHIPPATLPNAAAVINPHREDCKYPDKNLSGVGVAFKLCQSLYKMSKGKNFADDLEFVALGTIADIVPLVGENRKLVKLGLEAIQNSDKPGIQALIEVSALSGREIGPGQVGFGLAPRLNAAGRIGHAKDGVALLLSEDKKEAERIAEDLNDSNMERQEIEREILAEATSKLAKMDMSNKHSIVLTGENWHPGVIGIVASRLVDLYYLPTIIISCQGDIGKGSCRSIRALHMHDALSANESHLLGYGGHSQAAGLTIKTDEIDAFAASFDDYVAKTLKPADYIPTVEISAIMGPDEINEDFINELKLLEPYGMGNPKPVFGVRNISGKKPRVMGRDNQHLAFMLGKNSDRTALCWNNAKYVDIVARERLDLVYTAQMSEWQGENSIELVAQSIEPAEVERVHLNREALIKIYFFLKKYKDVSHIPSDSILLSNQYARSEKKHLSLFSMKEALKIFEEMGLLEYGAEKKYYMLKEPKTKLDLMSSKTYRAYNG